MKAGKYASIFQACKGGQHELSMRENNILMPPGGHLQYRSKSSPLLVSRWDMGQTKNIKYTAIKNVHSHIRLMCVQMLFFLFEAIKGGET